MNTTGIAQLGESLNRLLASVVSQLTPEQLEEYKRRVARGEAPFDALARIK